jgi:hypothetical protein
LRSKEGYGFFSGIKSLERQIEVRKGFDEKRRNGSRLPKDNSIAEKEKSFEGRSPRALGTEIMFPRSHTAL